MTVKGVHWHVYFNGTMVCARPIKMCQIFYSVSYLS